MKGNRVAPGNEKAGINEIAFNLPAVGLNDNLEFLGRQLHVQTEYIDHPIGRIATQVFCSGRIMLSRKSECPPAVLESRDTQLLQKTMNEQHQQVIREIKEKQTRVLGKQEPR
jgi:hypothetical protein